MEILPRGCGRLDPDVVELYKLAECRSTLHGAVSSVSESVQKLATVNVISSSSEPA
jgi:hypothetical protein